MSSTTARLSMPGRRPNWRKTKSAYRRWRGWRPRRGANFRFGPAELSRRPNLALNFLAADPHAAQVQILAEMDEISAEAGFQPAVLVVDSQQPRRGRCRHGQRIDEIGADRSMNVADRVQHRDRRPCQRSVVQREPEPFLGDAPAVELVNFRTACGGRHCVGDERNSAWPLRLESDARRRLVYVIAVSDEAANDARVGERRADDARRAMGELAHRVKEMRDGGRAGVEGGAGLFGRGG